MVPGLRLLLIWTNPDRPFSTCTELETQLGHGWFERMSTIKAAELEAVGSAVCAKKVHTVTHRECGMNRGAARFGGVEAKPGCRTTACA